MSKKILFFGNERLATGVNTTAPTLRGLIEAGYEIPAIVVSQGDLGKSRNPRDLEVAEIAQQHGIKIISPEKLDEAKDELQAFGAEAGVLVAFGKIVPEKVINIFPKGIINIHPSLLPEYRGSTPIESVILEGEDLTGVSIMSLTANMDAGPIYAQEKLPVKGNISKKELADQLNVMGAKLLIENLPAILEGRLKPKVQDKERVSYSEKIEKSDSELDYLKPAIQLEREIRAYAGWPRSRIKLGITDVIITRAHVGSASGMPGTVYLEDKLLGVFCSEGVLIIDSLIPTGKKEMPASAFLAGYTL